jgi:hypothetical protein
VSKIIITPTDTITITIDNRVNPPRADMRLSRDLPGTYVCGILAMLIGQICADLTRRLVGAPPPESPKATPEAIPFTPKES